MTDPAPKPTGEVAAEPGKTDLSRRAVLKGMGGLGAAAMLGLSGGRHRAAAAQTATATTGAAPISIGASVATTGAQGAAGLYQRQGYELWADELNRSGGLLGRPVRLVLYDDNSNPATAAKLYQRLLDQDKVDLVLGPYSSAVTLAVAPITDKAGQPLLAAGATASELWQRGYRYVFGVFSIAEDYFRDVVLDLAAPQGYKTAAIIYQETVFPEAVAKGAATYCAQAGIDVVATYTYTPAVLDLSADLRAIRAANPDLVLGGCYLDDAVLIVQQSKQLGVNPKLTALSVGPALPNFHDILQADADYICGPSMWEPQLHTIGNADFVAQFQARFNRAPSYQAADGYAAGQILAAAVEQVGSLDRDAIANALRSLELPTILPGIYKVNAQGEQVGHVPLAIQWQHGAKQIVAPSDLATADPILPTPPWSAR